MSLAQAFELAASSSRRVDDITSPTVDHHDDNNDNDTTFQLSDCMVWYKVVVPPTDRTTSTTISSSSTTTTTVGWWYPAIYFKSHTYSSKVQIGDDECSCEQYMYKGDTKPTRTIFKYVDNDPNVALIAVGILLFIYNKGYRYRLMKIVQLEKFKLNVVISLSKC